MQAFFISTNRWGNLDLKQSIWKVECYSGACKYSKCPSRWSLIGAAEENRLVRQRKASVICDECLFAVRIHVLHFAVVHFHCLPNECAIHSNLFLACLGADSWGLQLLPGILSQSEVVSLFEEIS